VQESQPTPPAPPRRPWHVLSREDVLAALDADGAAGLQPAEAARRLTEHGPNEIPEAPPRSALALLGSQFADVMIMVLVAAAVVSGVVGELLDTVAILVIVVLNAVVGAVQEFRAERAVQALRALGAPRARVCRDGAWSDQPAAELVPGDLVALQEGDVVSADVRLLDAPDLHVDEATLTGESLAVAKQVAPIEDPDAVPGDRRDMAFRGTVVTRGRARGVVVATGLVTELGRIAGLLQQAGTGRTPLQLRLARFGRVLALAVLVLCALLFAAGVARGEHWMLMLLTALSLAVAAIPEALPAVVTVSLALGARGMTRRNALVRRLPAVETLGSVTFVCADKTGTLTRNRMVVDAVVGGGERRDGLPPDADAGSRWDLLATAMALNNDAHLDPAAGTLRGDPTEVALVEAVEASGVSRPALERRLPRRAEVAFDSDRKRMTTVHAADEGALVLVKGAPEEVLERCTDDVSSAAAPGALAPGVEPAPAVSATSFDREDVLAQAMTLAGEGLRVLAFACRTLDELPPEGATDALERDLAFLGLVALVDPPREEAARSVARCRAAGVTPVMITGDHPATAAAIARRLGLADDQGAVLTGRDLERLTPEELREAARTTRVYARVSPDQKIAIVRALQEGGAFVAMTGDGVNDAPALRAAEIGVAMGRGGTEVAREAADMVLLDDDFSTIVAAIAEGRRVFDNIRKFVKYTLTSNSGEIGTLCLAPVLGLPLPLIPIQILWINLVTDGLPGLALAVEPAERGVMRRPPRPPREGILAGGLAAHALVIGLLIAGLSLAGQAWALGRGSPHWQTVVFTMLTFCQLAHALVIRSERESLATQGLLSNRPLLGAVVLTVLLQLAVVYVPWLQPVFGTTSLPPLELGVCLLAPVVVAAAVEFEKLLVRRGWLRAEPSPPSA
jgi:Ca2+-transporting ATPase